MGICTYKKGTAYKLSENFTSNEFDCHGNGCCSATKIDESLVFYLQKIREHFGQPITISSGYRCPTHNKNEGGETGSRHTKGQAADIVVKGVAPAEVAKYAESVGILGIGLYETKNDGFFVHIDTRTYKSFWYGQAQKYRSTFGGSKADATVKAWQEAAIADGYKFPKYGADGGWGSECEEVAKKAVCKRCYFPNWKNKNLVKIIQTHVGVSADGKFGAGTKNAVKAWQEENGLVADGEVGYNTWRKMIIGK